MLDRKAIEALIELNKDLLKKFNSEYSKVYLEGKIEAYQNVLSK